MLPYLHMIVTLPVCAGLQPRGGGGGYGLGWEPVESGHGISWEWLGWFWYQAAGFDDSCDSLLPAGGFKQENAMIREKCAGRVELLVRPISCVGRQRLRQHDVLKG